MSDYRPVIGLEVHAELLTQSKMFCGCAVVDSTTSEPNSSVCEICTGMPGTLPVINQRAVEFAIKVALALHCSVSETSVFARKNYFYPDLPKGYQISQYELPLAEDGWIDIEGEEGPKRVRVRRVHLEEDTGKLFHRDDHSLVDYNRSGVPLLEVVSEPDLTSVNEATRYATALRSLLQYLGVNSGDMEKGVIRFEANVSVRPAGTETLGTRTEIKNLNSFRAMARALEFEIERQSAVLAGGGEVRQQTLGWDESRQATSPQRSKETASDYRYFPEPDLPPLEVAASWVQQIEASLPELAPAKKSRYVEEYGLSDYSAGVLTAERETASFFEAVVASDRDLSPAALANWLSGELFGLLNQDGRSFKEVALSPEHFARLVALVEDGQISPASGKEALAEMLESGRAPDEIVAERDMGQIDDPDEIARWVEEALADNPDQVQQYLEGKTQIMNWLFGQIMRQTGGRGNPQMVRKTLEDSLAALAASST